MPGGDRTGPAGLGPMTGRQAGYCTGNSVPGYQSAPMGRGFGRGLGRGMGAGQGRGFGRGYAWRRQPVIQSPQLVVQTPIEPRAASNPELDLLKAQADSIQNTLESINQRIQKLEESSAS